MTLVREGIDAVREPMRDFLEGERERAERARFLDVAQSARRPRQTRRRHGATISTVLVPAFVVTELGEAFAIGFLIYLPFLVIDLVVSNILLALGMQMLSPTQVSLPFKLLLFVAIDGWGLLVAGAGRRGTGRSGARRGEERALDIASLARVESAPVTFRGNSSAGRALRSQCRGPGFDPPLLHRSRRKIRSDPESGEAESQNRGRKPL